ncbi:MAG: nucleotidyl transferase AbiEii/AbiGii toxin family protein [Thermodesulfobacteriota bacterium]
MFRVLSEMQAHALTALFKGGIGDLGYYLTGGTALAEFYLQHRRSDDLDIFTREKRPFKQHHERLLEILSEQGIEIVSQEISDEFMRFFVSQKGQEPGQLKVEFAWDVPSRMGPPITHGEIIVDSFEDIAVNKICAILEREPPEVKDFVDLFFILKETKYSVDYLVNRAGAKEGSLDTELGKLGFATNLSRVDAFHFLPRMIKPLTLAELKSLLLPIARDMILRMRPQRF